MKNKHLILISSFLISTAMFAQKDQLKAAERLLKEGNSKEAIATLQSAESLIAGAKDTEKAQFLYVKGNAFLDLANKKVEESQNLCSAAKSYLELVNFEKTSGKTKYSDELKASILGIKDRLVNLAIELQTNSKFKEASELLYQVYELDKTDLGKLYYSAIFAYYDKDNNKALAYFEELIKQNYTGEETQYFAKSLVNDKEVYFGNTSEAKADRDAKVKLKMYSDPREEKFPSKKGEIYKNVAYILANQGKILEAKKAFEETKKENPEDVNLIIAEAELYLKEKDILTFKKLLSTALEKNPNNAELITNLAITSHNNKEIDEAEKLYNKAISIDPKYIIAYVNLASLTLDKRNLILDQMNKLGNSTVDTKKYEFLKKQSDTLLKTQALPLLEKANELDPSNEDAKSLLLKIYGALDMTDKIKALKAK